MSSFQDDHISIQSTGMKNSMQTVSTWTEDQEIDGAGGKNFVPGRISLSQVRCLSSRVPELNSLM